MDETLVCRFSDSRNARGTTDRSSASNRVVFCCTAIWRWPGWHRRRSSVAQHGCDQRIGREGKVAQFACSRASPHCPPWLLWSYSVYCGLTNEVWAYLQCTSLVRESLVI